MGMAHFVDTIFVLIAFALPVYLVVRLNAAGVIFGALAFWLVLIVSGLVLAALDPSRSDFLDSLWVWTGWLAGLIYCALIYGLKKSYHFWRERRGRAI